MAIGIVRIAEKASIVIKALTPDQESGHAFVEYRGVASLDDSRLEGDEPLRLFTAYPELDPRAAFWNGELTELKQSIFIDLRYTVPDAHGGKLRAQKLSGADAAQITHALLKDWDWSSEDELTHIIQTGRPRLRSLGQGVYFSRLEFEASYFYGA
jgi:hypothetical protein